MKFSPSGILGLYAKGFEGCQGSVIGFVCEEGTMLIGGSSIDYYYQVDLSSCRLNPRRSPKIKRDETKRIQILLGFPIEWLPSLTSHHAVLTFTIEVRFGDHQSVNQVLLGHLLDC